MFQLQTTDFSSAKCATVVTMNVCRHTRSCEKLKLSVERTRFGIHRGQSATPVRHDHDVRTSNVVMWTTATPGTRDATGSALGLYALTLSSKLEDYCLSELSNVSCAVCSS